MNLCLNILNIIKPIICAINGACDGGDDAFCGGEPMFKELLRLMGVCLQLLH